VVVPLVPHDGGLGVQLDELGRVTCLSHGEP
jgi:hypothetical protein